MRQQARWSSLATAALVLAALLHQPLRAQDHAFGTAFDQTVVRILSHWSAPGAVISVVHDGEVVLQRGYGVRVAGGSVAPGARTLAPVQSVTKPFTSLAIGILVDDGILSWDDPVRTYIPEFDAGDPLASEHTTIRDLLTHRSGVPNTFPGTFYDPSYGSAELLRDLAASRPARPFREYVHYSQVGMGIVGEVISRATGMDWSEFVQSRLLEPLGMTSSFPDSRRMIDALGPAEEIDNLLFPASRQDGAVATSTWRVIAPAYCPAGCIVSTAEDMTRFLSLVLGRGRLGSTQLVSVESLEETMAPHTVRLSGFVTSYAGVMNPVSSVITWGMGWGIYDALGVRVIEHPGSGRGSSVVAVVPEMGLGVFVSTNATYSMDSDAVASALKFLAIETALDLPRSDWIAILGSGEG